MLIMEKKICIYVCVFLCVYITHITIKELVGRNYKDHQIMKTTPAERRGIKTQTDIS